MEEHIYYNSLFDCYSDLLTDKEKDCFMDYYEEDLSISEIAINKNISRSAVHKKVKTVIEKLEEYENILHLYEMKKSLTSLLNNNDISDIHLKIEEILNK